MSSSVTRRLPGDGRQGDRTDRVGVQLDSGSALGELGRLLIPRRRRRAWTRPDGTGTGRRNFRSSAGGGSKASAPRIFASVAGLDAGRGRPEEALQAFRSLPPDTCQPCDALEYGEVVRRRRARGLRARLLRDDTWRHAYNFRVWVDARNLADVHERLGQLYDEPERPRERGPALRGVHRTVAGRGPALQPRVRKAQVRLEEIVRERG